MASPEDGAGATASAAVLRPATADDIPFIVATERLPGFDRFIGRWSPEEHRALMVAPGIAYLMALRPGAAVPEGFAILRDLLDPDGNVFLKRVAVTTPGGGFGGPFMRAVTDWVFATTSAHRLWLDVLEGNRRAFRVYEKLGFRTEGLMRESFILPDGTRSGMIVMSLLRPEWEAAPAR